MYAKFPRTVEKLGRELLNTWGGTVFPLLDSLLIDDCEKHMASLGLPQGLVGAAQIERTAREKVKLLRT